MKRRGGDRECAAIFRAIPLHGLEAVNVACELALTDKVISADYIFNLLSRLHPTPPQILVATPDHLKLAKEPESNCDRYNQLLRSSNHVLH
jgi:hypothetical protein